MNMFRRDFLRAWAASPLAGWLVPRIRPAIGEGPADAATLYREAFGWSEGLGTDARESLRKAATLAIDDPRFGDLIERARPALGAIREASTLPGCDWGHATLSTTDLNRAHLNAGNVDVVRVAGLSCRRQARAGRCREALDDAFAGLALAHRVGTGGVLFARIMECAGEVSAFGALGRIVPGLGRSGLDDLGRRLDALPDPEPASSTIGPESRFILSTTRTRLAAIGPKIGEADWAELGFGPGEAAHLRTLTGGDRERMLAHLEDTIPVYAELARLLDLPRPGCWAALDAFAAREESLHPVAASLVEHAKGVRHVVDRMRALRAMLRAGIALVGGGEAAFLGVRDPFGPGPFGLEVREAGHRVRSALVDGGRPPVTLEIGDPD